MQRHFANPIFNGVGEVDLTIHEAWLGALAYSCQIYFDFSGYSDMAVGLARMMNVRLPYNFSSPYKAADIIEFWRRWHMTLSRFLRDYHTAPHRCDRCQFRSIPTTRRPLGSCPAPRQRGHNEPRTPGSLPESLNLRQDRR